MNGFNFNSKSIMKDMRSAEEKIVDSGFEDVVILKDFDYSSALIGVSDDNRAIYDYDLMVEYLMEEENWSLEDAIEWIDYNTIRALPYAGSDAPIIMYRILE